MIYKIIIKIFIIIIFANYIYLLNFKIYLIIYSIMSKAIVSHHNDFPINNYTVENGKRCYIYIYIKLFNIYIYI